MRGPLWQGSVVASGFVFDDEHLSRAALVDRLIALWGDGARLARRGGRTYLVGLAPARVDARVAPGAPLVLRDGRWLLGPVDDTTLASAPRESIIETLHGALLVTPLGELERIEPSELVELEAPRLEAHVELLAPPPDASPLPRVQPEPTTSADLFRPMFERLGQARSARAPRPTWWRRWAERLRGRRRPPREDATRRASRFDGLRRWFSSLGGPRGDAARTSSLFEGLRRWLTSLDGPRGDAARTSSLFDGLRRWLSRFGARSAPALPDPGGHPPSTPRAPSRVWTSLAALFRRLAAPLLASAQARQRRYLEGLRRRFAEGDLLEALHHAIPIGGEGSGAPALGVPGRREALVLLQVPGPGPTITLADQALADLKDVYRQAFNRLVAEGKLEEAAYVQAQLLRDVRAAVAFLEQHGRVELAAQLGAAHGLDPAELVRLWMAAGRPREAVLAARRANAFAPAVMLLEHRDRRLAQELREHWATFLAERGHFAEALEASAPLPAPPVGFDAWLVRAEEVGGASAATALAVTVARKKPSMAEARQRLETLLADEPSPALAMATADALLRHAPNGAEALHRDLWRRLVSAAGDGQAVDRALVDKVLAAANDEVLRADGVPLPTVQTGEAGAPFELAAEDRGRLPIHDVAELPRGRLAVALGAAGLAILGRDGSSLKHLPVKADALVAGVPGLPVLVVSRDGSLTRVLRLELHGFELQPWFQGELSCFARTHDGYCWAVGMDDAVVVLDVQASGPMEWWRVDGFRPKSIEAGGDHVWMHGIELATSRTAGRVWSMISQKQTAVLEPAQWCWSGLGGTRTWSAERLEDFRLRLGGGQSRTLTLPAGLWDFRNVPSGLVATCLEDAGTSVFAFPWADFRPHCLARLPGGRRVQLRASSAGGLLISDEHGRVVELTVPLGTVRRVHRV